MTMNALLEKVRNLKGSEGIIIRFDDGHMVKIKAEEYVRIHKVKDQIRTNRHIVDMIVNEKMDDVIGMLPKEDIDVLRAYEARFWTAFERKEQELLALGVRAKEEFENSPKRVALEFIPSLADNSVSAFVFGQIRGRDVREMLLDHVRKHLFTNVKWEECEQWMGV